MVLEGGYHTESLARGVHASLEVMAGADPQDPWAPGINEVEEAAGFHRDACRED
jgi:acetoin utilization deacetylase AcuC-like enzyme